MAIWIVGSKVYTYRLVIPCIVYICWTVEGLKLPCFVVFLNVWNI